MRLKEYQGKRLLKKYGIPIPKGRLITKPESAPQMLAKAQVLTGNRFKNGLILPATKKNLQFLFRHCPEVLLEKKLPVEKEFYLALTVDFREKKVVILFSKKGGVGVKNSSKIEKTAYENLSRFSHPEFLPIIKLMSDLMEDYQALLVEINPLALSLGKLVALDAKIILDDNVPHPEFEGKFSLLERQAKKYGLTYVELDGDIGVIGNGAGLVMTTLDLIEHFSGHAANFLDLGGGATKEKVVQALKIVLARKPRILLINIFGGITRCDEIAQGIIDYRKSRRLKIPLIVRMTGTRERRAKKILLENGITSYNSLEEAIEASVKNVHNH